ADVFFQGGVDHYNLAVQWGTKAFTAHNLGDTATELADLQSAKTEYGLARGVFDQLPASYPASIRLDNAAYLAGRCSYEIGTIDQIAFDHSKLPADQAAAIADFQDARTRLLAVQAAYPTSGFLHPVAYFLGRSRFHLAAEKPQPTPAYDTFAAARAEFVHALALQPAGTFADNAQYYVGRCWFEEGYHLVNVVPAPAVGSADWLAAKADLQSAEVELGKVLTSFPTSTYVDNARYYLGKSWFEEPVDSVTSPAIRQANVEKAIGYFTAVVGTAGSPFAVGARYWRGKAEYAHAFLTASGGVKNQADLAAAIADFGPIRPPETFADHALYYLVKCYTHVDPGPVCLPATSVGPPPTTACGALAALDALVATNPLYAASTYPPLARTYATTNGCTCP
ncbi:MAG TPA: hypothetical protein VFP50_17340, partial [Anaeromyxobacteraceae bacterium]|nr:hypothetical protein [Anaeromyxobacteraceae bacterium]